MSEIGSSLHECILKLNDCIGKQNNGNLSDYLIEDINRICLSSPLKEKDLAYACSLVLKRKDGLLQFLDESVNVPMFKNSLVNALQFLTSFLDIIGSKIVQYGIDIKDVIFSIFLRDQTAKVKAVALSIVIKVLFLCSGRITSEDLKIQELVDKVVTHLAQSSSKLSPTDPQFAIKYFVHVKKYREDCGLLEPEIEEEGVLALINKAATQPEQMSEERLRELEQPSSNTSGSTASGNDPGNVKQQIFYLLGVAAHHYPECLQQYSNRLLHWYLNGLKTQIKSSASKLEPSIIVGCLQGLTEFMYQFPVLASEDADKAYALYSYIRDILSKTETNRYEMTKAALTLLASHSPLFGQFLYDDYRNVFGKIVIWTRHINREMRSIGYDAMDALLKQISEMLLQTQEEKSASATVFKFFIDNFQSTMKSSTDFRGTSTAVRGYGYFAKACKVYMTENDVQYMLNDMIKRSEQLFLSQEILLEERIQMLPSFLESLASIVMHLQEISETSLTHLERLAVFQIEHFPHLPSPYHIFCYNALIKLFLAVFSKGPQFIGFLNRTIYQGIIRTCSHPVIFEVEAEKENMNELDSLIENPRKITYKSYISLWEHLLHIVQNKELNYLGISLEDRHKLTQAIFDEIISVFLTLLKKLDLETVYSEFADENIKSEENQISEKDVASTVSDPLYGLQPNKPRDFQIFINIVDFCRDLLSGKHAILFEKWIYTFGLDIIQHVSKHTYISGFYKLASVCLTICKRIRYFQDIKNIEKKSKNLKNSEKECLLAFKLFSKFSREVIMHLQQFKDDLLASCLEVVLSLPTEIVESEIHILIPALQTAFQLGLSYLPLAAACLDALETWISCLSSDILKDYYPQLLPCLNNYFLAASNISVEPLNKVQTIGKRASTMRKKKLPMRGVLSDKKTLQVYDSELMKIQHRILKFLGSLGNQHNSVMISSDDKMLNEAAVAWVIDNQDHLKFSLPFIDMKLEICLDKFLPRIVKLATTASDRQVKVAACESLHSVVSYMVGYGAQKTEDIQKKYPMDQLYKNVLPALLQLSCDVELVARQLFQPLVFQLIHWFTNKRTIGSKETMVFLQVIWDGLTQSKDTAYRDFSAQCLKEFVQWSIKQTSKKEQQENPINMKAVLDRMYNYSLHPGSFKRLGAALAFNSIYRIFREEESLINTFILEILINFVDSLALAHYDDKSIGTQEKCKQTLNHIEKIIKVKASMLNKPSKDRRTVRNLKEMTLSSVVEWLLLHCGCVQVECRHKCMELVFQLSPCLPDISEPKEYFVQVLKENGYNFYINCFEKEMPNASPHFDNTNDGLKSVINWLEGLLAMLDCYTWLFGQRVLQLSDIFNKKSDKDTKIFKSIQFYLSVLCSGNIEKSIQSFYASYSSKDQVFSPKEKNEYVRINCTVIVRLLNFLTLIVENYSTQIKVAIPSTFWNDHLWECIVLTVLNPSALGFDMTDIEIFTHLPKETSALLKVFCTYLPQELLNEFMKYVSGYLENKANINSLFPLKLNDNNLDCLKFQQLFSGYEQLIDCKIWPSRDSSKILDPLIHHMLTSVWDCCTAETEIGNCVAMISPLVLEVARKLLTVALKLGVQCKELVTRLLDQQLLFTSSLKSTAKKGLVVFYNFQFEITSFVAENSCTFISCLMNYIKEDKITTMKILIGVLDNIGRVKQLRHRYGKEFVNHVISNWSTLQCYLGEEYVDNAQYGILPILTKLLIIDSSIIKEISKPECHLIFSSYLSLLTKPGASLEFKIPVLDLLPFFLISSDDCTSQLQNALDALSAEHFPLQNSELISGSAQYNDYILAFSKIVTSLELTGNIMLLRFVIQAMCKESSHLLENNIQKCFEKLCKRLDQNKQKQIMEVPYKMFFEENRFPSDMRLQIMNRVCMMMLKIVRNTAFINFYTDHISEIMNMIKAKRKISDETQVVSKIGAFELMEILYQRLSKDDLSSKSSQINTSYCNRKVETGKELTTDITRCAHSARKENMKGEAVPLDLCRKYHCAAYNTIIAVISCTQSDVKFYATFLFQENTTKGEYIWENIVNLDKEYHFNIEFDSPVERKQQFISIRGNKQSSREGSDSSEYSSVHYMTSQYLADSSLSEDVSQFDFSTSELAFSSGRQETVSRQKRSLEGDTELNEEKPITKESLELETDELNQHECMITLTAAIQHMSKNGILSSDPKEIPKWMDNLCKKIEDKSVHKNIKIFITKLFINNAETHWLEKLYYKADQVLKPYSIYLLHTLMNLIMNGTFGVEINYFILDLMVVLLSWSTVTIPEDSSIGRHTASSLLEFLMKQCFHSRRDVFRNNLEMIKTVVECWKDRIDVPTRVIYSNMCNQNVKEKDNIVGIQLLGIILANGLVPYQNISGVDRSSFLKALLKNMKNKHKVVYASAAEVCGMIMKYYFDNERTVYDEFCSMVKECIMDLYNNKRDQFVMCLHKMHFYSPSFIDSELLKKLLFMLPGVHGIYRRLILEIIQSRIEIIEDVFVELKNKGLLNMLEHRDEAIQLLSLKTLQKALDILKLDDMLIVFPIISKIHKTADKFCREVIYEIMMHIFEKFCNASGVKEKELYRYAQEILLHGLTDVDLALKLTVHNFWSNESRLPVDTLPRLIAVLQKMYSPATEHQFLQYSTFLLMEMTSRSPDYKRKIFMHPLSECKFQSYNISSSWRQRHAPMTPLFIESLTTQSSLSSIPSSVESMDEDHVRATVENMDFEPTLDPASKKKTFNWLTQTSLDTMGEWNSLESSSSLLFTIGRRSTKLVTEDKKAVQTAKSTKQDKSESKSEKMHSSNLFRLRKRFLKDTEKSRLFFIKAEMRRKQLREDKEKERQKMREGQVTIYRQYRIGDLPDIEIVHSAIITPLQALAQHDQNICCMLFQSLVSSVCCMLKQDQPEEYPITCKKISDAINDILSRSIQYSPSLVAFCEEVMHNDIKEMNIECEQISIASQASNKQNLGILLLEETLMNIGNSEQSSSGKRTKLSTPVISQETSIWIKMAEIYKSLNDYDTVHGIFSHSLQIQPETREALQFEARGDYVSAVKIYSELYDQTQWPNGEPDQAEIDMWDDAILQCYSLLTRWDHLETNVINHFQDPSQREISLEKVWEENYYQEHYLPFLIRSKLKLLIENRNDQSLLCFIDSSMKDENKKKYLEDHFPEELALLYVIQENYDRAQYYFNSCVQEFLKEWIGLNILTPSIRKMKLQSLQKVIELQEFLTFMDTPDNFRSEYIIKKLINQWLERFPNIHDPVNVWDDIIMNRSLYMEKIVGKFQEVTGSQVNLSSREDSVGSSSFVDNASNFDAENFLMEQKLIMKLKFVESALDQQNISVALRHLKWTQQVAKKLSIDCHWVNCIHLYCKTYLQKAKKQNHSEQLDTLIYAHKQLAKLEVQFSGKLDLLTMEHYLLQSEVLENFVDILAYSKANDVHLNIEKTKELKTFFSISSSEKLIPDLLHKCYEYKCRATDIVQTAKRESKIDESRVGETYMELANFCNKYLRKEEESENEEFEFPETKSYPIVLVNSLLEALRYGNASAMKLFPRLLQIIEIYPDSIPDFIEKSKTVPCWLFLSWINQLVALLDKKESFAVQSIVEEIRIHYPNALIYPFKLSSEGYSFPKTSEGKRNEEFVKRLKSSLSQMFLIDDFISALNHLSVPHIEFKEFYREIMTMKKKKAEKKDILETFNKIWNNLFIKENPDSRVGIGKLHEKFANKFGRKITAEFGKDGSKLFTISLKDLNDKFNVLNNEMSKIAVKTGAITLKSLSTWLSEFQSLKYPSDIEIPGQYSGKKKPIPEFHVKISSFDQTVRILSSLTEPRCLTIRGNDEKEYRFLVKAGEDLRQDSRIEQLFVLMNDIYASDVICSQHKIKLETYQVIPLTSRIGLIEWVDNTKVLKQFLMDAMTDWEQKLYDGRSSPREVHQKWLFSKCTKKNIHIPTAYENICKVSNSETCKKFAEIVNLVPWDLFRRAFLKFSASLEAFVILRSNFIISHAVLCISQWLLGIGDRHASNFLISLFSGCEIGIDFGHAFGSATQFLPVPELMPFRLTPQYLNLMLPLKEKSIIEATMIATLNALRKNHDILLNTMDVFIKEPTVNWQENALRQKDAGTATEDADKDINWYPKQRIQLAKRKMEGINPCYITREELRLGHGKGSAFSSYVGVCMGGRERIRNSLPENALTVEQQVAALIDQATDPSILGRTWMGWEAWL